MDSFFGIGFPELVFILILAGLVMGPQRIRQVARTLGRFIGQMQSISHQFTRQLNAELDALDSDEVKGAMQDVKQLRREMDDLRRQVRSIPQEWAEEGRRAAAEGERVFKPRSRPLPDADDINSSDEEEAAEVVPTPDSLPTPIEVADDPE